MYNNYYIDGYVISYSDFIRCFERLTVDEQRAIDNLSEHGIKPIISASGKSILGISFVDFSR
jgi:hypothetical protein